MAIDEVMKSPARRGFLKVALVGLEKSP